MAIPHFKVAASHIRQGIAAKHHVAGLTLGEFDDKSFEKLQAFAMLKTEIRALETTMSLPPERQKDPATDRARKTRIVMEKHKEISAKERELMMEKDRLLNEIRGREQELADLEAHARDLEARG